MIKRLVHPQLVQLFRIFQTIKIRMQQDEAVLSLVMLHKGVGGAWRVSDTGQRFYHAARQSGLACAQPAFQQDRISNLQFTRQSCAESGVGGRVTRRTAALLFAVTAERKALAVFLFSYKNLNSRNRGSRWC